MNSQLANEQLKQEWTATWQQYNNAWPDKAKRKELLHNLREIENRMVQELDFKVGMVFYHSWGYDQTNIDLCQIVEISSTKKTVMCRMMSKKAVESFQTYDNVGPNQAYGIPFRLKVSCYQNEPVLRGSYPAFQHDYTKCKLCTENNINTFMCPKISNAEPYRFWLGDTREYRCKDCNNNYKEPHIDWYDDGHFTPYTHPVYQTNPQFGH
jgi:uncharacterized protein YlaI